MGIIVCSWTTIGVYVWQYEELKRIKKLFKQTNGYFLIDLRLKTSINDLFGFCCFFGTIKFYRLCRFNQRL